MNGGAGDSRHYTDNLRDQASALPRVRVPVTVSVTGASEDVVNGGAGDSRHYTDNLRDQASALPRVRVPVTVSVTGASEDVVNGGAGDSRGLESHTGTSTR